MPVHFPYIDIVLAVGKWDRDIIWVCLKIGVKPSIFRPYHIKLVSDLSIYPTICPFLCESISRFFHDFGVHPRRCNARRIVSQRWRPDKVFPGWCHFFLKPKKKNFPWKIISRNPAFQFSVKKWFADFLSWSHFSAGVHCAGPPAHCRPADPRLLAKIIEPEESYWLGYGCV